MILFEDLSCAIVEYIGPVGEPVTVAQAKAQARCTHSSEDSLFSEWIGTARQLIEEDTSRRLYRQEIKVYLNRFPTREIKINCCPVVGVDAIDYIDSAGFLVTMDLDDVVISTACEPAIIVPAYGKNWPAAREQPESVTIYCDVGYDADSAPPLAKQLIRTLVAHWFRNREDVGKIPSSMQETYQNIVRRLSYRGYR